MKDVRHVDVEGRHRMGRSRRTATTRELYTGVGRVSKQRSAGRLVGEIIEFPWQCRQSGLF